MSDAAAPENRSDERRDLQTKNIQDRHRCLRGDGAWRRLRAGLTRHFLNETIGSEGSEGHCHINRFYWSVLISSRRPVSIKSMG
jgi:hypothetical protein